MNAKKAKACRKFVNRTGKPWDQREYVESQHPKEKPHQKVYLFKIDPKRKNSPLKEVFAKVRTMKLSEDCGRSYYKLFKKALVA